MIEAKHEFEPECFGKEFKFRPVCGGWGRYPRLEVWPARGGILLGEISNGSFQATGGYYYTPAKLRELADAIEGLQQ